jgi:hypothetical protein
MRDITRLLNTSQVDARELTQFFRRSCTPRMNLGGENCARIDSSAVPSLLRLAEQIDGSCARSAADECVPHRH